MPRCDTLCVNMSRTRDTLAATTANRGVPDRDTEPTAVDRIDDALEKCRIWSEYVSVEGLVRTTERWSRYW